jgi:hypothetical protein
MCALPGRRRPRRATFKEWRFIRVGSKAGGDGGALLMAKITQRFVALRRPLGLAWLCGRLDMRTCAIALSLAMWKRLFSDYPRFDNTPDLREEIRG